jgi:hypothetical protein
MAYNVGVMTSVDANPYVFERTVEHPKETEMCNRRISMMHQFNMMNMHKVNGGAIKHMTIITQPL